MNSRHSLSNRVFAAVFSVALVLIVVFTMAGTVFIQTRLKDTARMQLRDEANIVAASLNEAFDDEGLLKHMKLDDIRLTLVQFGGTVMYDSSMDADSLPNHAKRPEVAQAFKTGHGSSERASSSLGEVMLYEAVRLKDGNVVRLAQRQAGYLAIFSTLVGPLLLLAAVGAAVSLFTARREANAIIAPLQLVDLDHPKRNAQNAYAEMIPMLERIESQRQELKRQVRVLADNDRMRREFTANITHELKTPLTAISGYAELIANGMVATEEDKRDFGHRIYKEAGHLTSLVNDILTLSNLDEAEHSDSDHPGETLGAREPVDLPRLLDTVEQRLERVAAKNGVHIELACEPVTVRGVPRLLDELAYNLASNAIRYNKPGGIVRLSCGVEDGHPFLCVSDTGIGIAKEEQAKVFERFYRVDKSRSKARGGTGLGLAIVKHAAVFHKATINLQSELGKGTTIRVSFPEQEPLQH